MDYDVHLHSEEILYLVSLHIHIGFLITDSQDTVVYADPIIHSSLLVPLFWPIIFEYQLFYPSGRLSDLHGPDL